MKPSNESAGRVLNIPGVSGGASGSRGSGPRQRAAPAPAVSSPPPSAGDDSGPAGSAAPPSGEGEPKQVKHLAEVKEFIHNFIVAEKNYQLYPSYSKVVKHSLDKLAEALEALQEAVKSSVQLTVSQKDLLYEDQIVYHEEHTGKSLAYRLYTDGVRGVAFHEGADSQELVDFIDCFKELRKSTEEENDFGTLFWEKDAQNIQLQVVDDTDTTANEEIPDIPDQHVFNLGFNPDTLRLPPGEEERLKEELASRLSEDDGDSTFELTEEEAEKIRELALEEEVYFPVYDFVDILIELMIKNGDPEAFKQATKMIRSIIFALVENLDFDHAAELLRKLSTDAHPGLTSEHKRQIKEMIGRFCDKQTLELLSSYLAENASLPEEHGLFKFLTVFDHNVVPHICRLLSHHQHIPTISKILVEIGKDSVAVFAKFLQDPDSEIAKAMILILARLESKQGIQRIAEALRHPDETLRKFAARTILELANKDAAPYLLPLLDEKSPQLVYFALQFFSRVQSEEVYEKLLELTRSDRFFELSKAQQAQAYNALISCGGDGGLDYVLGSVLKRTFTFGKKSAKRKAAALLALSGYTDQKVIDVLQRFAQRTGTLASTAKHALRLMLAEEKNTRRDEQEAPKEISHVGE